MILTNPDMLHVGILPHHDRWGDVLPNLALRRRRRGARLPRRLRLARRERAAPAAPARARLRRGAAVPARLGDDREPRRARAVAARRGGDGDRRRRRAARRADDRALEPALLDEELGLRASALGEASRLLAGLVVARPAHDLLREEPQGAELIHRFTAERLDAETAARLSPYRAGYTPAQRREIERRLVEGELLGVAATDALELGIDIG